MYHVLIFYTFSEPVFIWFLLELFYFNSKLSSRCTVLYGVGRENLASRVTILSTFAFFTDIAFFTHARRAFLVFSVFLKLLFLRLKTKNLETD